MFCNGMVLFMLTRYWHASRVYICTTILAAMMVIARQTNHTVHTCGGLTQLGWVNLLASKVNEQLLQIQTNHIIGLPVYLLKLEIANHDFWLIADRQTNDFDE